MARTSKKQTRTTRNSGKNKIDTIVVNSGFASFKKMMDDLQSARAEHVQAIKEIDAQIAASRKEIMDLLGISTQAKPIATAHVEIAAAPAAPAPAQTEAPKRRGRKAAEEPKQSGVQWDNLMKFCKDQDLMGEVRKANASSVDAVIKVINEYEWAEEDLTNEEVALLKMIGATIQ